jgi:hypothetical protein
MEWEKAIYESLQGILVVFVMPKYQKKKRRMLDETNEKCIFFFVITHCIKVISCTTWRQTKWLLTDMWFFMKILFGIGSNVVLKKNQLI